MRSGIIYHTLYLLNIVSSCVKSYWVGEESFTWPTVCVLPFLSVSYIPQFNQIFDSQLVVFYAPITDEVLYGQLIQRIYLVEALITVVASVAHIGVREVFEPLPVFT